MRANKSKNGTWQVVDDSGKVLCTFDWRLKNAEYFAKLFAASEDLYRAVEVAAKEIPRVVPSDNYRGERRKRAWERLTEVDEQLRAVLVREV